MASTFTQVAPDGQGDKIAGQSVTRGADEVVQQEVVIGGNTNTPSIAEVLSTVPESGDHGLVVRPLDEDIFATGTITTTDLVLGTPSTGGALLSGTPTPGSYVAIRCPGGSSSWQVLVTGLSSGNLYFEKSINSTNGIDGSWGSTSARMEGFNVGVFLRIVANLNAHYSGNTAGPAWFRVRSSGALSGTPSVTITVGKGVAGVHLNGPIPIGTNNIGRITLADAGNTSAIVAVKNTALIGSEYALAVRPIVNDGVASGAIAATDLVLGAHPPTGAPLSGTPTPGSYVFLGVPPGQSVLNVEIGAHTSGTILFERSLSSSNGVDGYWVPVYLSKTGSADKSYVSSASAVGVYQGPIGASKYVRVRSWGGLTDTSQIIITTSSGAGVVSLNEAIPAGTNTIGNVGVTALPALPAGNNNIGDVDVLTLPSLPAGNNNIGDVDIVTLPALPPGGNNIGDVDVLTLPALPAGNNNIGDVDVLTLPALPPGTNNIGDVDVLTLPALPAGANLIGQTQERPSTLCVTVTAAVNTLTTLTLPAPGANQFIYLTKLEIGMYATAARTGAAAPVVVTTTNLPGTPAFTFETAQAIGTMVRDKHEFESPIKSTTANTAVTVVGTQTANVIWRLTAFYYTGP